MAGQTAKPLGSAHTGVLAAQITNYSMPDMNGAQLAKAALEINPALPILVATGYADLPAGAGINLPRLGKPYTQDQLAFEIAKVLRPGWRSEPG